MPISGARRALEQHNVDRMKLAEALMTARHLNEQARASARFAWQITGHAAILQDLARDLEERIAEASRVNERLQQTALEIITALGT